MPFKDGRHLIDPVGNFFKTLENCEGWYSCPLDKDGNPIGPIVGYTADHPNKDGTKWCGLHYANFSMADPLPAVLKSFAEEARTRLVAHGFADQIDLVVGAPWAGIKFSQVVAQMLGCRHIFAEKYANKLILGRYEGHIHEGDIVTIGEELVNNQSTTGKLVDLIEAQGGRVLCITAAVNRSSPFTNTFWDVPKRDPIPIISVIEKEMPQFHVSDPKIAKAIKEYGLVPKPKYEWDNLKTAMETHRKDAPG